MHNYTFFMNKMNKQKPDGIFRRAKNSFSLVKRGDIAQRLKVQPALVFLQNAFLVQMRIVGKLQNFGIGDFRFRIEEQRRNAAVSHIESRAKRRVGNIQQTAQKRQAKALVSKERNPFFIRL